MQSFNTQSVTPTSIGDYEGVFGFEPYSYRYVCPECGKAFLASGQHVYKWNSKLFCSWSCLRKSEKSDHAKARKFKQSCLETVGISRSKACKIL